MKIILVNGVIIEDVLCIDFADDLVKTVFHNRPSEIIKINHIDKIEA